MGRPVFYDGGDCMGVRVVRGQTRGRCSVCEKDQVVSKNAWRRAGRPQCRECGGYLLPSKAAQKRENLQVEFKAAPKKACMFCHCTLRAGNENSYCSACVSKAAFFTQHFYPSEIMDAKIEQFRDEGQHYAFTGSVRMKFQREERRYVDYKIEKKGV